MATTTTVYCNSYGSHGEASQSGFGIWYGGASGLMAGNWTDPYGNYGYFVGHMDIPLNGSIPAGRTVLSATLTVELESGNGSVMGNPGALSVYTTNTGTNAGIFGTAPSPVSYVGSLSGSYTPTAYWTAALTASTVQTACYGGGANGLLLYGPGAVQGQTNRVNFNTGSNVVYSKEYVTITYAAAPGTPGAVTAPTAGTSISGPATISWGAAADADTASNLLVYQIDLSTNGGSNWTTIINATAAGAVSATHDFSPVATTTTAQLRIRAKDPDNLYGGYATSGTFAINHQTHQIML